MDAKLALKLNKRVINQAKAYAKRHHKSLSGLVENYFKNLTGMQKADDVELSPLVKRLSEVFKLNPGFDFKKEYASHLENKYK